jgi:hypothetical protein
MEVIETTQAKIIESYTYIFPIKGEEIINSKLENLVKKKKKINNVTHRHCTRLRHHPS